VWSDFHARAEAFVHHASALSNTSSLGQATIHYPFHPLRGLKLDLLSRPRDPALPVTLRTPNGTSLKVPSWMLAAEASAAAVSEAPPALSIEALLQLASLCGAAVKPETESRQQSTSEREPKAGRKHNADEAQAEPAAAAAKRAGTPRGASRGHADRADGERPTNRSNSRNGKS